MTNRREFLQIGVSATAWPLVAGTLQATGIEPPPELVPLSLVVYDTTPAIAAPSPLGRSQAPIASATIVSGPLTSCAMRPSRPS